MLVVGFVLSVIFYADDTVTDTVRFTALKDGVARIVRTFGDKLLAFKFPPRTARKLQGFIDYN